MFFFFCSVQSHYCVAAGMVFSKATEPLCFCRASVTCVLLLVIFSLTLLRAIWVPQLLVSHRLSWRMLTLALSALTAVSLVALRNQVNTARFGVKRGLRIQWRSAWQQGERCFRISDTADVPDSWIPSSCIVNCLLEQKKKIVFHCSDKKCTKMPMSKNPHQYEKDLRSSLASVFTTKSLYPATIIIIF